MSLPNSPPWLLESRRLYPEFIRELTQTSGLAIDFQELGAVDLAYSADELATLEARAARQTALGIESKPLQPNRITTFWPRVRKEGLAGARFYPNDGLVNPREVVLALCAVCRPLGVRFVQNCAVQRIDDHTSDVLFTTSNGSESFDTALIAAGAWSGSIKVTPTAIPASRPVKGHLLGYQQPSQTCNTLIRHGHTYLMQRANGLFIAGASVENVGFDRHIDADVVSGLVAKAGFVMPHLLETTPTETWNGFRPASDQIHLGRWQSGKIFLAYGHYRNGILLAPVTAERLAAEVTAS